MCEICDLHEETTKLHSEMMFRFQQFQVELMAGRAVEAEKVEVRLSALQKLILTNLRKSVRLQKGEPEIRLN